MKQNQLIKISNVVKPTSASTTSSTAPKLKWWAWVYCMADPASARRLCSTQRLPAWLHLSETGSLYNRQDFSVKLLTTLYEHFSINDVVPTGTTDNVFKLCIEILEDHLKR